MIKEKLEAIKHENVNLYEHLVKVLRQMILSNDRDSYQLFEYYSQKAKNDESLPSQFRNEEYQELVEYVNKTKNILNKPNTGTEEEPA